MSNLEQLPLKDIHFPDAVSWWPLAPGWWLLALAVLLATAIVSWWLRAAAPRRRAGRLRRIALGELERLEADYGSGLDTARVMQELSILLRRAAMSLGPRAQVAGLTGERWIAWLSASDVGNALDERSLRLLAVAPYQRTHVQDVAGVILACRRWLETFETGDTGRDPV